MVQTDRIDLADELEEDFHVYALDAVGVAGDIVLAKVQRKLRLLRGTPQTSAPEGQPPEFDTGDLFRSFKKLRPRVKGRIASSGIYSLDPGANRLEFGKTDERGIRTLPHPFVRPAFEESEPEIHALFQKRFGAV